MGVSLVRALSYLCNDCGIELGVVRANSRIVFFPLYPQYAGPTTATANDEAFRTLQEMKWQPAIRTGEG